MWVVNICTHIYIYIDSPFRFLTYSHIAKLLYELSSWVLCYPKIKLSPGVKGFCCILCCV